MTAATITPATTAGDLLTELRELLQRHDGAETLDQARQLADDVTGVLRRARGRLTRLARKTAPTERPADKPASTDGDAPKAVMPLPRPQDAPPLSTWRRSPLDDAASLHARKRRAYEDYQMTVLRAELGTRAHDALTVVPERPAPHVPPASPAFPAPSASAPRRLLTFALTALAAAWMMLTATARRVTRRLAAAERDESEVCIVCGPGCISPILGRHTSCPGPRTDASVVIFR
jgi:hypothetical protein